MESLYSEPELKELSIQVIQEHRARNEVKILEERLAELKKALEQAETEKNKEVKESEDAKNNVFMKLLFSAKVEKEELEAYIASEKYDVALDTYKTVESQLQNAKRQLAKLDGCKEKYEKRYAAKRNALLAEKGDDADKILELEKEIDTLTVRCKEAKEALDVCNKGFETSVLILNRLGDAEYSLKMNKFAPRYDASLMELSKLNSVMDATKLAKELRELLKRLRKEMQDITLSMEIRDACLDTKTDDWVRVIGRNGGLSREIRHIKELLEEITAMSNDISKARTGIETYIKNCETQFNTKETELKQIIFR